MTRAAEANPMRGPHALSTWEGALKVHPMSPTHYECRRNAKYEKEKTYPISHLLGLSGLSIIYKTPEPIFRLK